MIETHPAFQPDNTMFLPPTLPTGGTVSAAHVALLQPNPYQLEPAMLSLSGIGPVAPRSMTVCSVHFRTMKLRFHHSGRRLFVLPAAEKGKFTVLRFFDSQQAVHNTAMQGDSDVREYLPMPVPVESIAQDFRSNWCAGYVGPMGRFPPGIDVIAGEYPTKVELDALNDRQERMCRALVEEGDAIEKGTIKNVRIGDDHRDALEWMGSEKRSWFRPIEKGYSKVSVITGNHIPMEALADGGQDILEYYVKYDLDPLMYQDEHAAKLFAEKPAMKTQIARRLGMVVPSIPNGK